MTNKDLKEKLLQQRYQERYEKLQEMRNKHNKKLWEELKRKEAQQLSIQEKLQTNIYKNAFDMVKDYEIFKYKWEKFIDANLTLYQCDYDKNITKNIGKQVERLLDSVVKLISPKNKGEPNE